jgi:bacterioferritin-associated ferredoxin
MYVCHCEGVTDRTVDAAISSGARCVADVTARCGAGGGCGSCHETLEALLAACLPAPDQAELADLSAA